MNNLDLSSIECLTANEVAKKFRLAKRTITRHYAELGGFRVGSSYRFPVGKLMEKINAFTEKEWQVDSVCQDKRTEITKAVQHQGGSRGMGGGYQKKSTGGGDPSENRHGLGVGK